MRIEGSYNNNAGLPDRLGIHAYVKELYKDPNLRGNIESVRVYAQENGEIHIETDVLELEDQDWIQIYNAQLKAHQRSREMDGEAPFFFEEYGREDISFRKLMREGEVYIFSDMPDPFSQENLEMLSLKAQESEIENSGPST